jgi:adenylyltransferase/sulfurtransferase
MAELRYMKALVEPGRTLTEAEIQRYSRHVLIPEINLVGQQRIANAKVLCVGAGGLGSTNIMYLAAAGIGTIGIIDFDVVQLSNLQRQVIHFHKDIGERKVVSAAKKINELNPNINVIVYDEMLDHANAVEIFAGYDLIIDGTDNFATRYLINDAAALVNKPYIWGSIYQFDGAASVFWSKVGPCYRCLHPTPPPLGSVPSCAEGGVLGAICATVGSIQVTEAIKLITGIGEPLLGTLLIYDALKSEQKRVPVKVNPDCPICNGTQLQLLDDYQAFCGVSQEYLTASELKSMFLNKEDFLLVDVREPWEFAECSIPGAQLIPLGQFKDGSAINTLSRDREIVLHCRSGQRSADCLKILTDAGFEKVTHLEGGILAWIEQENQEKS